VHTQMRMPTYAADSSHAHRLIPCKCVRIFTFGRQQQRTHEM